ncbi:MAG: hypothetical protein K6E61_03535, partial [Bacteroidales bacterium]|nr:hypothetical protein [Bacteroidales bacterium]
EQCPKEVSGENGKEIVMYKGKPAVVITYSSNGKAVTLRLSRNDFKTVMLSEVKPYTGDKDAISLGF